QILVAPVVRERQASEGLLRWTCPSGGLAPPRVVRPSQLGGSRSRRRLPNVPPLSSGRIRKAGGNRWRRASPWYLTTGEREAALSSDEARPSASTACWAAASGRFGLNHPFLYDLTVAFHEAESAGIEFAPMPRCT